MRAMVVEADMLSARRLSDALETAGFNVVGPARSSGEGLVLARRESPDVVIVAVDLEVRGIGQQLAEKLERELQVPALLANMDVDESGNDGCDSLIKAALKRRRRFSS